MIVCPNCNHQNPEGASQCEACYAPLPITIGCPNCGASVQSDATFCGQCGFNLQAEIGQNFGMSSGFSTPKQESKADRTPELVDAEIPPTTPSMSIPSPWDDDITPFSDRSVSKEPIESEYNGFEDSPDVPTQPGGDRFDSRSEPYEDTAASSYGRSEPDLYAELYGEPTAVSYTQPTADPYQEPAVSSSAQPTSEPYAEIVEEENAYREDVYPELVDDPNMDLATDPYAASMPATEAQPQREEAVYTPPPIPPSKPAVDPSSSSVTQLQTQKVSLYHVQTNTNLDIAQHLSIIHLGKPNSQIPPDVDVSGFPNSEIVSRIHADIRVEGDAYFIEDVGSSNGTYINHTPLLPGNRHRLRNGDRIALGKGDKVTFIFQIT